MLGDNLSHHKNLQVLSAQSVEELQTILRSIQLPFALLFIYSQGNRHYAWINPSKPVKVVKKKRKTKVKLGSTTTEEV